MNESTLPLLSILQKINQGAPEAAQRIIDRALEIQKDNFCNPEWAVAAPPASCARLNISKLFRRLNIFPTTTARPALSLAGPADDWKAVGNDLRQAIREYIEAHPENPPTLDAVEQASLTPL